MGANKVGIYIFYGIPCVGKSTTAVEFAFGQGIRTVVHTDYVREIQRSYVSPEQVPALAKVSHNAWELFGSRTRENIESGFVEHAAQVAVGVSTVVRKLIIDGFDAVVEGVHFHGGIINELARTFAEADINATLLTVATSDELLRRITEKEHARARSAERKDWQPNLPIMLAIQEFLVADARASGIAVITADEWKRRWVPSRVGFSTSTMS